MKWFKSTNRMQRLLVCISIVLVFTQELKSQEILTLEKALQIAETESPDLQRSLLNLERFSKNLEAQSAALKSRFSLELQPVGFNRNRRFDTRVSQWYTNENFETNALLRVQQPVLLTDGTISLTNEFGWQSSYSDASDLRSQVFYNNL